MRVPKENVEGVLLGLIDTVCIVMPFFLCLTLKGTKLRCPDASWWRQMPTAYSRS